MEVFVILFQQYHFPGLAELIILNPVEIDSAG